MIVTRFQIHCDGDHGIPIFWPEEGAVDGAIYTPAEARQDARKAGWGRRSDQGGYVDLCPDCLSTHKSEMKRSRRPEKKG